MTPELLSRRLRDRLRPGLDVVFVGINPGRHSAAAGHHYAGPGNHFWPLLYEAGFVDERLTHEDEARVLEWGIGLTNMAERPTAAAADLSLAELREGAARLRRKLERYAPRFACFNGKRIYEVFAGHPCRLGLQPETIGQATRAFVMPSTSPRGASYQRADKLRSFRELHALAYANGAARRSAET